MHLGEIIKQYREEHGLSMQSFADKCDLSKGYIAMLERNVNSKTGEPVVPSMDTFIKVSKAMGKSLLSLMTEVDENQPIDISSLQPDFMVKTDSLEFFLEAKKKSPNKIRAISIPVLGRVQAGIPIDAQEEVLDWEEIAPQMALSGDYFALQVRGDSMEPKFSEGDVVIVRQQDDAESGDIVIAMVNGNDATIKKLMKYENGGIALVASNPLYQPLHFSDQEIVDMPVAIIGKVVELRAKF